MIQESKKLSKKGMKYTLKFTSTAFKLQKKSYFLSCYPVVALFFRLSYMRSYNTKLDNNGERAALEATHHRV